MMITTVMKEGELTKGLKGGNTVKTARELEFILQFHDDEMQSVSPATEQQVGLVSHMISRWLEEHREGLDNDKQTA